MILIFLKISFMMCIQCVYKNSYTLFDLFSNYSEFFSNVSISAYFDQRCSKWFEQKLELVSLLIYHFQILFVFSG